MRGIFIHVLGGTLFTSAIITIYKFDGSYRGMAAAMTTDTRMTLISVNSSTTIDSISVTAYSSRMLAFHGFTAGSPAMPARLPTTFVNFLPHTSSHGCINRTNGV